MKSPNQNLQWPKNGLVMASISSVDGPKKVKSWGGELEFPYLSRFLKHGAFLESTKSLLKKRAGLSIYIYIAC